MKKIFLTLVAALLIALTVIATQAQEVLTETYTAPDNSFSIMYPAGWTIDAQSGYTRFTTVPRMAASDPYASGEMGMTLNSNAFLADVGVTGDTIRDFVISYFTVLNAQIPDIEDLTVDGHPAARAVTSGANTDSEVIGVDYGNGQKTLITGVTFQGELANLDATMQAMLITLQFGASTATSTLAPTSVPTTTISLQPELLWTDDTHSTNVPSVAFSPDDTSLAVAGSLSADFGARYDLALVDSATGNVLQTFTGHEQSVSQVAFSPDGTTIASIDLPSLRVWDVATGANLLTIQKEGEFMVNVAYNPQDGSLAYVSQADPSDTLWRLDIASGQDEALYTVEDRNNVLDGLAFSPDGSTILFGVKDYSGEGFDAQTTVYQLDLATRDAVKVFDHGDVDQLALLYPAEGQPLIAVTLRDSKAVQVWDITTDTLLYSLSEAQTEDGTVVATRRAAINPAGTILATGSISVDAQLWDAQTGAPLATLDRDQELLLNDPMGLAFSHDSSRIAVGYSNSTVSMWRLNDANAVPESADPASPEGQVSVVTSTSEGGEYIVSVSLPANWRGTPLSFSDQASIALLASGPNNIGGDVKFPANSRGGNTPQAVANSFIGFITGTVTEFEVNGRPAARLDGMSGENVILYIVVTTSAGDFALASFYGTAEMLAEEEATLLEIAASVTTGDPDSATVAATPVPTTTAATAAPELAATATSGTAVIVDCTVSASSAVNLRSGAGTQFERAGTLDAGSSASVTGQATADGYVWWQLEGGNWVRSDVVLESGNCEAVPSVGA